MSSPVLTATGSYRVVPGEPWRTQALALIPLVDEWTAAAPADVRAGSLTPGVHAHVTGGHLVLTGIPALAWPHLDTVDQHAVVRLVRPGRPSETVTVTVPLGSSLPYVAAALPVASVTIALAGRVSAAAFPHGPVAGATIDVSGPAAAPLVAVSVPLGAAHAAGTTLQPRALTAGPATGAVGVSPAGADVLTLAATGGLGPGTVLDLGAEFAVVDAVLSGELVRLRVPLARSVPDAAPVTPMTLGVAGAPVTLRRAARPGDGVLLCTTAPAAGVVEVVDGAATEYRRTELVTGADGQWRLAGVRGVPEIVLTTAAAGFLTDGPTTWLLAPIDPFVRNLALRT